MTRTIKVVSSFHVGFQLFGHYRVISLGTVHVCYLPNATNELERREREREKVRERKIEKEENERVRNIARKVDRGCEEDTKKYRKRKCMVE